MGRGFEHLHGHQTWSCRIERIIAHLLSENTKRNELLWHTIPRSSATVVEMEYTRNSKFLGEIYADSSSVGSTITDKMQIPSLHISLLLSFLLLPVSCLFYICREMIIQGSLPCLYTIHNEYSVL